MQAAIGKQVIKKTANKMAAKAQNAVGLGENSDERKVSGLCSFCPARTPFCYVDIKFLPKFRAGTCALLGMMIFCFCFILLSFMSNTLTVSKNNESTNYCRWNQFCLEVDATDAKVKVCDKYSNIEEERSMSKNAGTGGSWLFFNILTFLTMIVQLLLIVDFDYEHLPVPMYLDKKKMKLINFGLSVLCFTLLTISWGGWADNNTCKIVFEPTYYGGHQNGASINLQICSWIVLTFFYLPISFPSVEAFLFENYWDVKDQPSSTSGAKGRH